MDMALWQDRNCTMCAKYTTYNSRLKRMPEYKCAVQRQMEGQAMGEMEINIRSWDACQNARCPFFKSALPETPGNAPILDFSQGECIVDQTEPKKAEDEPKTGKNDEKTAVSVPNLPKTEPKRPKIAQKPQKRDIAAMWDELQSRKEEQFRQSVHDDVMKRLQSFTFVEHMRIAFAPLVLAHIAWMYTERVLRYAADNRISMFKKLCRATRHVRDEYVSSLRRDLTFADIANIERQTEEFHAEHQNDFTIMRIQCIADLRRMYGNDAPHMEMRADAYVATVILVALDEHNTRMDALIRERMGRCDVTARNPHMVKLRDCLDAFQGEKPLIFGGQVQLCKQIVHKNLATIEWCSENKA